MSGDPPPALHLHIDGASRGNPGEAGFGIHVTTPEGAELAQLYGYLGPASNNVAEYQALLHGLRYALARGARRVHVFSDSGLVVRQMSGSYRVKHPAMVHVRDPIVKGVPERGKAAVGMRFRGGAFGDVFSGLLGQSQQGHLHIVL